MTALSFTPLFVAAAAAALVALAVYIWLRRVRLPRDRSAPHRLGRELGWRQLTESEEVGGIWYGAESAGHVVAATYINLPFGSKRQPPSLTVAPVYLSLRLAVALEANETADIVAYFPPGRRHEAGHFPPDFEAAFDRRHTERLNPASRDALLAFAQTHGSVRLRDRADAPAGLFPGELMPDVQVVLVHERRGYQQSAHEMQVLLDALTNLARRLELDPVYAQAAERASEGIA